jgi:hypothetical protein
MTECSVRRGVFLALVDRPEHADALVQRVAKTPGVEDVGPMLRISAENEAA